MMRPWSGIEIKVCKQVNTVLCDLQTGKASMQHVTKSTIVAVLGTFCVLGTLVIHTGCSKSDSDGGGASIPGAGNSEVVNLVRAELEKHWLKTSDGWISEFPSSVSSQVIFRQIKELKFEVSSDKLSEADKLNGIEFKGACRFQNSVSRSYDSWGPAKWSDWRDDNLDGLPVLKEKGQWQLASFSKWTTGIKPEESALAKLK